MGILLLLGLIALAFALVRIVILCNDEQFGRARGIALRTALSVSAYLAIVIVAALPSPASAPAIGTHCDDDWCMSVDSIAKTPTASGRLNYRLAVHIFSRANHGPRSAKGAWLYLTDERGRRFGLAPDASAVPFDVALEPHESVATSLTFNVPLDARGLQLSGGLDGISLASFMIGNGDLLHQPRMQLRID
jgi:hypothetical protein